jgi:short-subunit dehydrogenase
MESTNQKKIVLLTGSNSGIGLATCKLLSENGYFIYAGVRTNEAYNFIKEQNLANVEPVLLDLTKTEQIKEATEKIKNACNSNGKFYALINNAAFALGGPIELADIDSVKHTFEVNLFGIIELIKNMLPIIRKDVGRIINVSSTNAIISFPFLSIYSATKFALEAITDSLRLELNKWGIKVSTIYPDVVKTPIFDKSIPVSFEHFKSNDPEKQDLYKSEFDSFIKTINKMVSKGVEPEVIAKSILKCLNARKPKISYIPEKNGKLSLVLKKFLSKKSLDKFLLKELNK